MTNTESYLDQNDRAYVEQLQRFARASKAELLAYLVTLNLENSRVREAMARRDVVLQAAVDYIKACQEANDGHDLGTFQALERAVDEHVEDL